MVQAEQLSLEVSILSSHIFCQVATNIACTLPRRAVHQQCASTQLLGRCEAQTCCNRIALHMACRYGQPQFWQRDNAAGTWSCTQDWPPGSALGPAAQAHHPQQQPKLVSEPRLLDSKEQGAPLVNTDDELGHQLRASLVIVDVTIPLIGLIDGVHSRSFAGELLHLASTLMLQAQGSRVHFRGQLPCCCACTSCWCALAAALLGATHEAGMSLVLHV